MRAENRIAPDSTILVTGGYGFIGSNLVRYLLTRTDHHVVNVDAITYAGNPANLADLHDHPRYRFFKTDLCDARRIADVIGESAPDQVIHLAAESHVDRSIDGPARFMNTNVLGTTHLLQAFRTHYAECDPGRRKSMRLLHVSTDEVFGSLGGCGRFNESTPYDPHSPYAASKAASDHVVRAWYHTFGVPVVVTHSSNNYGPYQFPEKLVPVVILNAIAERPIPVYGDGKNVRDWLFVEDHVRALYAALGNGGLGQTYTIGGDNERSNNELVKQICRILDRIQPRRDGRSYREQIEYVPDRPGHDFRYAIDATKIRDELGWRPREDSTSGLEKTVRWYLDHRRWWQAILDNTYHLERLGLPNR